MSPIALKYLRAIGRYWFKLPYGSKALSEQIMAKIYGAIWRHMAFMG